MSVHRHAGLGLRHPVVAREARVVLAGLLALAAGSARAAPEATPDCIVIPRSAGASLLIDGKLEAIPSNGKLVKNCGSARFAEPSVRVTYITAPDAPVPQGYNSVAADRNVPISARLNVTAPLRRFFDLSPPKPSPAATYAGVMSVYVVAQGTQVVAVDLLKVVSNGRRDTPALLSVRGAEPGSEPVRLEPVAQTCLDEGKRVLPCDALTASPLLRVSAYRMKAAGVDTLPGFAYVVGSDRLATTTYAGATFYLMKALLDRLDESARKEPVTDRAPLTPADRFDALLADLVYAQLAADAERAAAARSRLQAEFPDLSRQIAESLDD